MLELLAMHGFAIYIWPAYTFTAVVFAINIWHVFSEKKKIKKWLTEIEYES